MLVSLYGISMPTRRTEKAGSQFSGLIPGLCQLKCQSAPLPFEAWRVHRAVAPLSRRGSEHSDSRARGDERSGRGLCRGSAARVEAARAEARFGGDEDLRRSRALGRVGGVMHSAAASIRRRSSASTRRRRSIPGHARGCSLSGGCGRTRIGRSRRPRWRLGRAKAYYLLLYLAVAIGLGRYSLQPIPDLLLALCDGVRPL